MFDVVAPVSFSYKSTEGHRQNWQQWFDSVPGPTRCEMNIMNIVIDDDGQDAAAIASSVSLNVATQLMLTSAVAATALDAGTMRRAVARLFV